MNSEHKIALKQDPNLSQKSLSHFLIQKNYKRVPNWFSFFLRNQWGFSKDQVNGVYVKLLLNLFPLWYLGFQFTQDQQLQLNFYTKGISLLDFFGIRRRWEEEVKNLQNLL